MANYGTQTVGALFQEIESDIQGMLIVLPGDEPISSTMAYLQTTNASVANVKAALYNTSNGLVYESNQFSFTDDTGGWKAITWPATTPTAGTYIHVVGGGSIAGGSNTVNLAVDTVTASTNYKRASTSTGGIQSTYPAFPATITWDAADYTQNPSLYLVTSSGGGGSARAKKRILRPGLRLGLNGGF